ncbi:related to FLR1-Putative H+ antiporter regulated by yAP-1 and involved in multidrug resistance [Rhynchosporium graminicola]|uniref:Related to FLR1-Putative H+ antiporter regulated by yAP-1 and involved in multidrug resistance n=1 Tax=Rhynchosporium graminicola TaxID=2792576 RepID=A0A1E1JXP6_9HELO|nr:related to FLR1-Putative H+ antiporter regulated by yAP-1 and involved in multidrug resistance [Rhynchosporium commune]
MVYELVRDTALGHALRFVTRGKVMTFEEERDPSLWKRYVDKEKSGNMAHHGHTGEEDQEKDIKQGEDSESPERRSGEKDVERGDGANQGPPMTQSGGVLNGHGRRSSETRHGRSEDGQHKNELSGVPVHPEKGKDVHIVSWYGENDPENPLSWSTPKKFFVTAMICLLTFSVYIGSAIYSAGTTEITEVFGVSQVAATLGLTLFVAGYGLGPMIWAPMSEIPQIGRNPIYIGTLVVFVFFQFGVIYAKNFGMLLAFRFLTGFFGSPVLATGGASLSDMYRPAKRAYAIGIWGLAAICGPVLGPLVGGFAAQHRGWKWPIWELLWLSGFALIVLIVCLPETSSANILYRRSRRLRKLTGRTDLKCEPEIAGESMTTKDIAVMTLVRPFSLTFTEPILFVLNLYIALVYGILYIWFESFAIVFIEIYHFNLGLEGLSFVGILVGALVTIGPFFLYLYYIQEPQFNKNGEIKPEKRLPPAFVGAFCLPICLFWFGWSSRESVHWIVPIIGSSFFSIGAFLLFNSVLNYLGDAYPEYAASVLAGNDFFRSSFGAGFPLFANAMYTKLGVGGASSLLGGLSVLFIPVPFVLYKYGDRIRKASKRARHDL